MDNLSRTQEILKGKGLTAEQALMHITALENKVAFMDHELGQLHDNFDELAYSDTACSQYYSEDVFTLLNIYQNRMQRFLRYMMNIITAMKAQTAEPEEPAETEEPAADDVDDHMKMMLSICYKHPEFYNKVSNILYKDLDLQSAEVTLTCTYVFLKMIGVIGND